MNNDTNHMDKTIAEKPPTDNAPPLVKNASMMQLIDALLKSHEQMYQLFNTGSGISNMIKLLFIALFGFSLYGVLMGAFSMGIQWVVVPAKIFLITLLSALLCFPSLYILSALSGATLSVKQAGALLLTSLGLVALLLLGFAPVAFVFTVSIASLPFMGLVHLLIWGISFFFGFHFFKKGVQFLGGKDVMMIKVWMMIFLLTFAQMSTVFRPILGEGRPIFVTEKHFFLDHWRQTLELGR